MQNAPESEVQRLIRTISTLSEENANLLSENERLRGVKAKTESVRAEMERFRRAYAEKFRALRGGLEDFRVRYPHFANPANAAREHREVEAARMECGRLRERLKRRESLLKKYENFYRAAKQGGEPDL